MGKNAQEMARIGEKMFGPRWKAGVGKLLGAHYTQVHRWASGKYEPSDEVIARLKELRRQKAADMMKGG